MRAIAHLPGLNRPLRLVVGAILVTGLVAGATSAFAADDDDGESFEQGIIRNIMRGIGATNLDNGGIEYRERSPLVIPPSTNLRPPEDQRQTTPANWPKDPDVADAKARRELAKKKRGTRDATQESVEASRILSPSELAGQPVSRSRNSDSVIPGATNPNPILNPSELGYTGGFMGMFQSKKAEAERFTKEPERENLTQPPVGYQTPSPNYAYGSGPPGSFTPNYSPQTNPALDNKR